MIAKHPKCKVCKKPTRSFNSLNAYCSSDCQMVWLKSTKGKKVVSITAKRRHKAKLAEVRLPHWLAVTQKVVNQYVRLRDYAQPCISCGKWDWELKDSFSGKWHCGHYKTVGARSQLRFNTKNMNKQCVSCNAYNGGSLTGQIEGITARYGIERLDWLDGHHSSKEYDTAYLKRMRSVFNKKIKIMQTRIKDK